MCSAIKTYYLETGRKVGIKPSGGMTISEDALMYYLIVNEVLGQEWLNNNLFRLGASRLANNLLKDILRFDNKTDFKAYF
jgi:deoxyribose-phosphate aldolase